MSSSASLTSGVAGRYATALFEIARDAKTLDALEADLNAISAALDDSSDLRDMISSPIYTREQQASAIDAVARKMGLGQQTTNTLGLMAQNRRLFVVPAMVAQIAALIADDRGEVSAEVVSAVPLTDAQTQALSETIAKGAGKDIKMNVKVDESLIGGLVVRVGSRMIDTSIRSKLANLQNIMKEVG